MSGYQETWQPDPSHDLADQMHFGKQLRAGGIVARDIDTYFQSTWPQMWDHAASVWRKTPEEMREAVRAYGRWLIAVANHAADVSAAGNADRQAPGVDPMHQGCDDARYIEQQLADPGNSIDDGPLVRDMRDGRIGVTRAIYDGSYLVEFADGTEVKAACDLQAVGPDPEVAARAEQRRAEAEDARGNAANCADPTTAAEWRARAERIDQEAARLQASSMDWLAGPLSVHGSDGPPPASDPPQQGYGPAYRRCDPEAAAADDDVDGM